MKNTLNKIARDTNISLKKFINKQGNSRLVPAIKYGLFPGGKKCKNSRNKIPPAAEKDAKISKFLTNLLPQVCAL